MSDPKKNQKKRQNLLEKAGLWLVRHDPSQVTLSPRFFSIVSLGLAFFLGGFILDSSVRFVQTPLPELAITSPQEIRADFIEAMVAGYPIEAMIPAISEQSKMTSAFLVSIAKKESNWGKRVPRAADGSDCYNYWGYTGSGSRGVAMGHACFGSPEEAITVVGGRINGFIHDYQFNTPEELIVWKCGFSCAGHSQTSVRKWIKDVSYYYHQMNN
jgi:hypothetical protein